MKNKIEKYSKKRKLNKKKYSKKRKLNKKKYSKKRKLNKKKYSKKRIRNKINKKLIKNLKTLLLKIDKIIKYKMKGGSPSVDSSQGGAAAPSNDQLSHVVSYQGAAAPSNDQLSHVDSSQGAAAAPSNDPLLPHQRVRVSKKILSEGVKLKYEDDELKKKHKESINPQNSNIETEQAIQDLLYKGNKEAQLLALPESEILINDLLLSLMPFYEEGAAIKYLLQKVEDVFAAPIFGTFIDMGTDFTKTQIKILNKVIPKIIIYIDTIKDSELRYLLNQLSLQWKDLLVFYKNRKQ